MNGAAFRCGALVALGVLLACGGFSAAFAQTQPARTACDILNERSNAYPSLRAGRDTGVTLPLSVAEVPNLPSVAKINTTQSTLPASAAIERAGEGWRIKTGVLRETGLQIALDCPGGFASSGGTLALVDVIPDVVVTWPTTVTRTMAQPFTFNLFIDINAFGLTIDGTGYTAEDLAGAALKWNSQVPRDRLGITNDLKITATNATIKTARFNSGMFAGTPNARAFIQVTATPTNSAPVVITAKYRGFEESRRFFANDPKRVVAACRSSLSRDLGERTLYGPYASTGQSIRDYSILEPILNADEYSIGDLNRIRLNVQGTTVPLQFERQMVSTPGPGQSWLKVSAHVLSSSDPMPPSGTKSARLVCGEPPTDISAVPPGDQTINNGDGFVSRAFSINFRADAKLAAPATVSALAADGTYSVEFMLNGDPTLQFKYDQAIDSADVQAIPPQNSGFSISSGAITQIETWSGVDATTKAARTKIRIKVKAGASGPVTLSIPGNYIADGQTFPFRVPFTAPARRP